MNKFLIVFFAFISILLWQNSSQAITISPDKLEFKSAGGEPLTQTITVLNEETAKINIRVYPRDLYFDKKGKKLYKEPGVLKNSFARYITVSPENFTLKEQEKKTVKVTVNAPSNVTGGTESLVFFEASSAKPVDFKKFNTHVSFNTRLGTVILYENPNSLQIRSRIKEVKVKKEVNPDSLNIDLAVTNTGNSHFYGSAIVAITGENDQFIGNISIPQKLILPARDSLLTGSWRGKLKPGQYHALITYIYGDKNVVIDKVFSLN